MGLTQQQLEAIVEKLENKRTQALKSKDHAAFGALYQSDAVLVHKGKRSVYGPKAIVEAFEKSFESANKLKSERQGVYECNNGEFIIRKGRYSVGGPFFQFLQIFRKQPNGEYFIIHDEFEFA